MTDSAVKMLERLPLGRNRPWLAYGGALALCALAFSIRLLVTAMMPTGYPFISFFPTVVLATFLFGARPGIFTAVVLAVLALYFSLPPFEGGRVSDSTFFALAFYAAVAGINIALIHMLQDSNRRLVAERERNARLVERGELLFRELQHRVSNNLQVVSGLLQLQMRDVSDVLAHHALGEAARRLGLIGRIHRQLYSPHGDQLRFGTFLEQLGADLIDASGKPGVELRVEAHDDIDLPADAVVPIALIVSEAVTNAIEHGFAERDGGLVVIRLGRAADGRLELAVIDDGAGLLAGFGEARAERLGLKLSEMLARQLGGEFSLTSGDRTTALLRLT